MMLEIDDDAIYSIMMSRLTQDYKMVLSDIEKLQDLAVNGGLQRYQQIDLNDNLVIARHLEAVLEYYGGHNWADKL